MASRDKRHIPLLITTVFRLLRLKVIAQIASKLFSSYERVWDTLAIIERYAKYGILGKVRNEKEFDLLGERDAEELKGFITAKDVVLDVGCGIGRIEKHLAKYCTEIHAVDVSNRMVKRARRRLKGLDNVYIYKNNGRDLALFPDDKFNFVFSVAVLQHLEKEDAVFYLYEIHRVLKNEGKLYFSVPNFLDEGNFRNFMDEYVKKPSSRTIIRMRYYCPEEVKKILTSIGFSIVQLRANAYIEVLAKKSMQADLEK